MTQTRTAAASLAVQLWWLHLTLLPLYLFRGSRVQPANVLLLLCAVVLWLQRDRGMRPQSSAGGAGMRAVFAPALQWMAFFTTYTALVALVWSAILGSAEPLAFPAFYLYNLVTFSLGARLAGIDPLRFVMASRSAIYWGLGITAVYMTVTGGFTAEERNVGLSDNSNQLSFFCLNVAVVAFFSIRRGLGKPAFNLAMIGLAVLVSLASQSRAGGVACFVLMAVSLWQSMRNSSNFLIAVICVAAAVFYAAGSSWYSKNVERTQRVEKLYGDEVQGRGYDRILDDPQFLFLGAAEGDYKRFGGVFASIGGELHSTLGTVVFSYGLPGLFAFVTFYLHIVRRGRGMLEWLALLTPLLLYGMVHNGLRFPVTWAMFAFVLAAGGMGPQKVRRPVPAQPWRMVPRAGVAPTASSDAPASG